MSYFAAQVNGEIRQDLVSSLTDEVKLIDLSFCHRTLIERMEHQVNERHLER